MNSDKIYDVIEAIAATSSKKEKEAVIREHGGFADFRRVLAAALDPTVTYGIEEVPERTSKVSIEVFGNAVWGLLERLARRDITGNDARSCIQLSMNFLSPQSGELLKRILKGDLRAGFGASTVNKAIPGLIPEFPYMRCALPKAVKFETFAWSRGVLSQEKADGMFVNIDRYEDGSIRLMSRQGSVFPIAQFGPLVAEAQALLKFGTQSHGELLVMRRGRLLPREQSNGILNSVLKGGTFADDEAAACLLWDQIPLSAVKTKGTYTVEYEDRHYDLFEQIGDDGSVLAMIPTRRVESLEEAYEHYRELLAQGKEGTIVKDPRAVWKDGTSKQQVKLKLEVDVDLVIVGFRPGEGKNADTFGSIIGRTSDALLECGVSGFTDVKRKEIHEQREDLLGTVMAVRANSVMVPVVEGELYSLFLPRCIEFRQDKVTADTLPQVRAQFDAAMGIVPA